MKSIAKTRIEKELKMFNNSPTPGISCTTSGDELHNLSGVIMGAPGTPFEHGLFKLDIQIPDRYPFEPPCVRFITPIYHPNIDTNGRICLDTLKPPPQGSWKPHLNLSTVLMMIRVLMAEPGTEDPLMADIWQEFKYDYHTYVEKARQWTARYASGDMVCDSSIKVSSVCDSKNKETSDKLHFKSKSPLAVSSKEIIATDETITFPRKRLLGLKTSKKNSDSVENDVKKLKQ